MIDIWARNGQALEKLLQQEKVTVLETLSNASVKPTIAFRDLADISFASPQAGMILMTGSDFLDALAGAYQNYAGARQRKDLELLVATTYIGLTSLQKVETPNTSLLMDHLYNLKSQADRDFSRPSLLADLVTNTPLIAKLTGSALSKQTDRLHKLLDVLETYKSPSLSRSRRPAKQVSDKGKARLLQPNTEMHMHRMSLVTQVQDLFPDLGSGFVMRLLDEYGDDVEQVTAHLLEDSLPEHLRALDRSEQASAPIVNEKAQIEQLAPRSTPPPRESFIPQRRNVFDDDEFDRLAVDASRLHLGKKPEESAPGQPNKAAILSALAAFDSDDDERDDTYDVEDVGGTVDTAHPDGEPGPSAKVTQEENDMALFTAYKSVPDIFGRSFNTRRGQARQALKAETGMTDEQIEGWAIMLQRDPRRLKKLEAQIGEFDGKQVDIAKTAYRESPVGTETEDSDVPAERGGYRGRGRGRGRGGRGGGGDVAGAASEPSTAAAQRRKQANKSSRANHNRRDQRARKMARGGFPG